MATKGDSMLQTILLSALRKKETKNAFLSSNAFELNPSSFCIPIQFKCKINSLQSLTFLLKIVLRLHNFCLQTPLQMLYILNSLKRKTGQRVIRRESKTDSYSKGPTIFGLTLS